MFDTDFPFWTIFIFFTWVLSAQDLICDGTVKASSAVQSVVSRNIDFSAVKVNLFTEEGHLKDEVRCIQTGLFFLSLYERGTFILKVEGPEGWTFKPSELKLQIDSLEPPCNQKLEFFFTGFSLSGFVHGLKLPSCTHKGSGPMGIEISLKDEDGEMRQCKTDASGKFVFDNVFPGKFSLAANTGSFSARNGVTREIEMNLQNTVLSDPFQVGGMTLQGSVARSNKQGLGGVTIILSTKDEVELGCGSTQCETETDAKGQFQFDDLACGMYQVTAAYVLEDTQYRFQKNMIEAEVLHATASDVNFVLVGMSSAGVVQDVQGRPVAGAEVILSNENIGTTDDSGRFYVDVLQEGKKYSLTAKSSGLRFESHSNIVASKELPVLRASAMEVCGVVDPKKPSVRKQGRQVRVEDMKGGAVTSGTTDSEGKYCVMLGLGEYKVKAVVSSSEARAGIVLSPPFRQVTISEDRESRQNIDFFQAQVQLGGTVNCLGSCGSDVVVELSGSGMHLRSSPVEPSGKFSFSDVTPGQYQVNVKYDLWCWEESTLEIEVSFEDMTDLVFQQSGYIVSLKTSHEVELDVLHREKVIDSFDMPKGFKTQCLPNPGTYQFKPKGCYKFENDEYSFDTASPKHIVMRANAFLIVGDVHVSPAETKLETIEITVDSAGGSSRGTIIEARFKSMISDSEYLYQYEFWGVQSEHYTFKPKTSSLLFYPQTHSVSVSGQVCPPQVKQFQARPGLFIRGEVRDGIEGAQIVVTDTTQKFHQEHVTDKDGKYSIGPLYDDLTYNVSASKEGYEITRLSEYVFQGLKLGTVEVKVFDDNGAPLPEVTVTLTKGDASFLKHLPTEANGIRKFMGLFPGKYYVRTTLKEYRFDQGVTTDIEVKEGADESFTFTATRIAYSVFGSTKTLAGIPVNDVIVEAIPLDSKAHHEETRSLNDGSFRLRGLQPGHEYKVQVKSSNENVDRSTPESFSIKIDPKDFVGANFIIFEPLKSFSLGGFVNTTSDQVLDIQLCTTRNERKVLRTIQIGPAMRYFDFDSLPPSKPGEKYVIKIAAPELAHQTPISENAYVVLDSHKHVDLFFKTQPQKGESATSSSYIPFLCWLCILLSILNYDWVFPMMNRKMSDFGQWLFGRILKEAEEEEKQGASARRGDSTPRTPRSKSQGKKPKKRKPKKPNRRY